MWWFSLLIVASLLVAALHFCGRLARFAARYAAETDDWF
jgi:hypothetical protein